MVPTTGKFYWVGRHATTPELGAPVSKVHRAGLCLLDSLGWTRVPNDAPDIVPMFAFTTRKGANYPADRPGLPRVRQFPHANTACLDDKCCLQQHLRAAGRQQLLPPSWDSFDDFMAWLAEQPPQLKSRQPQQVLGREQHLYQQLQQQALSPPQLQQQPQRQQIIEQQQREQEQPLLRGQQQQQQEQEQQQQQQLLQAAQQEQHMPSQAQHGTSGMGAQPQQQLQLLPGSIFIKHRHGVKGQAVYVAHTIEQVQQLRQRLKHSASELVVQQEVPPLLLDRRKFVLRVHILVTQAPRRVYVHEDVILLKHARDYEVGGTSAAAHISSKGGGHPKPLLLGQLPELHAAVWPQLQRLAVASIEAVAPALFPSDIAPGAVLYHLFGYDVLVDAGCQAVLLEVNSYPAVASGTMAAVEVGVYTRLVRGLVTLLVLPLTDGDEPNPGGFVMVG